MKIKLFLTNKILIYLASRYISYGVQFFVSLIIAAKMGPYFFGIYGFITLILNYCAVISFGIPASLNVLLVHHKTQENTCGNYIGNALLFYTIQSLLLFVLYLVLVISDIEIDNNYPIKEYYLLIAIIASLNYFNSIFINVLRIKNKVNQLSVVQSLNVLLNVIVVCIVKGENLIIALLLCNLISGIASVIVTKLCDALPPLKKILIKITFLKEILGKGMYLFFCNSCFAFILISIRSLISANYKVEEFGAFTFSFSIANSVMLLLEVLMTIIFPKLVDLLSFNDNKIVENTLEKLRGTYISSAHLLIYVAMLFFPILLNFMPKYSNALTSMNLIALAVLMNTNSSGYSTLLISKNKERTSAVLSMTALIINIILGYSLISFFHVGFSYVILAALFTYIYFSFMVVVEGRKCLCKSSMVSTFKSFFPIRLFIPYLVALIISCLQYENFIWLPLVLYMILNKRDIFMMFNTAKKLIINPDIINI
nr:oligosaccharide flippase family protein [Bacteroides intestinalis]